MDDIRIIEDATRIFPLRARLTDTHRTSKADLFTVHLLSSTEKVRLNLQEVEWRARNAEFMFSNRRNSLPYNAIRNDAENRSDAARF